MTKRLSRRSVASYCITMRTERTHAFVAVQSCLKVNTSLTRVVAGRVFIM